MGTAILATLTQLFAGHTTLGCDAARVLLVAAWTLMCTFTVMFAVRCRQEPGAWNASLRGVGSSAWGMVSMGVLAVGGATATVGVAWTAVESSVAWSLDEALWVVGTCIGVVSTVGFVAMLIRERPAQPRPPWGLAVVPPMVSATCGAPFVGFIEAPALAWALVFILVACFVCSLVLGSIIFGMSYRYHFGVSAIPLSLSASAWIPLGVIGQSTAAAQAITWQMPVLVTADTASRLHHAANVYGFVMLGLAIPLVVFATVMTVRGALQRMPFSPGWWALTFPLGTVALGALNLSIGTQTHGYYLVGELVWSALICTWSLCVVATGYAMRKASAWAR